MCVCVCLCVCVCVCICIYICMYVYVYIYINNAYTISADGLVGACTAAHSDTAANELNIQECRILEADTTITRRNLSESGRPKRGVALKWLTTSRASVDTSRASRLD